MKNERIERLIVRIQEEFGISLRNTFLDGVENARPILKSMVNTAMNFRDPQYDLWSIGKTLQRGSKYDIPYQAELEVSAGLWYIIFNGMV